MRNLLKALIIFALIGLTTACNDTTQSGHSSDQPDTLDAPDGTDTPDGIDMFDGIDTPDGTDTPDGADKPDTGERVSQEEVVAELRHAQQTTTTQLLAERAVDFGPELSYTGSEAGHMDLIQASSAALNPAQMDALDAHGFVISETREYPTFAYGYEQIYFEDLPVYVSADSIIHAVHRSYDDILQGIETAALIPGLRTLLESMRAELQNTPPGEVDADIAKQVDFYLAVALSLLDGQQAAPVAGASASDIGDFVAKANAHNGTETLELFGDTREVDFSQFKPRGHYSGIAQLEQYFRAMIWLGRIDLRMLESDPMGVVHFHRDQFEIAYQLYRLLDDDSRELWASIDAAIGAFVGERDSMSVPEFAPMLQDLGVATADELAALSDDEIIDTIQSRGYGFQRIASHIMYNGIGQGTLPLSASFLLLGQRYVPDSHVFANVVYDRVNGDGPRRMMPDPLDAAFAALGNDHAAALLEDELQTYAYAGDLNAMRTLIDDYDDGFWEENLYNRWMSALRVLSPDGTQADPTAHGMPQVTGTEAWSRRLLNTQMASWAELRHDTLLYAKQSYTGGATCEFPDAYVDPYPEFFHRLTGYAQHGQQVVTDLSARFPDAYQLPRMSSYFDELITVSTTLAEMAESQRSGTPFSDAQMAFINETVVIHDGCGEPSSAGWYSRLFYHNYSSVEFDPTIADVHTQPTDAAGNPVGRVLHVGTGSARLMVVTADTCNGPRAYVGLASSYFEKITDDYERLNDEDWADQLYSNPPEDVEWMQDIVVGQP